LQQAEQIEAALRRGESVFVFPEGTFTAQSGVRPFHLGAFKAAIATQRKIVPIALEGTRQVLRDGTWLPRPRRITITICPPIDPPPSTENWQEIVRARDSARAIIARFACEPLL
jgi:1-acyl-sn-glycerol-3-phosphate acyltransferase